MKFRIEEKLITKEELLTFEDKLKGLSLPDDYKKHMLTFNGGYPELDNVYFNGNPNIKLDYLHPIKYGGPTMENELVMASVLPEGYVVIGDILGGSVCISLNSGDYGNVFVYYEDVVPEKIANSFTEFIDGLGEYQFF